MAKSIVKEDCDLSSGRCDRFCLSDPRRRVLQVGPGVPGQCEHPVEVQGVAAFPGHGQIKPEQLEIVRLKREVAKLKAERDILKKAAAYFAKEST